MTKRRFFWITGALVMALAAYWLWTPDLDLRRLQASYLRSPADLINVDGTQLHVRDDGPRNAPAIIMLHGIGASLHTWEPWAQALAGDYRVIRFDLPGSGLSPPDPANDYTDERSLRLLDVLMQQLGVRSATVIGNSMGGRLAWRFAAAYPARVDRLVLVSPDGFASPPFEYDKAPEVPGVMALMRYVLPRALVAANLRPAYGDPAKLTPPLLDRYHDLLRAPGARAALLERLRQTLLHDPIPTLRSIQAPTLLMWGSRDAMIPISNAADYQAALPHNTLVRLDGLGHLPQEEDPGRSLPPLRAFLSAPITVNATPRAEAGVVQPMSLRRS